MFAQSRARKVVAVRDQGIELFFRREVHLGFIGVAPMGHVRESGYGGVLKEGYYRVAPVLIHL